MRATDPGFKAHAGRGTGRYASKLAESLNRRVGFSTQTTENFLPRHSDDKHLSLELLGSDRLRLKSWQNSLVERLPFGKQTCANQIFMPQVFRSSGVDGIHFIAHGDAPVFCGVPYAVTVLDLIPLRFPDLYAADNPGWRFRLARYLELRAICGARGFISISECTKRDMVELLNIDPQDIFVTPLAVDSSFTARPLTLDGMCDEKSLLRKRFDIDKDNLVLLYLGGIDPRKNCKFLLEVLKALREQDSGELNPILVLAGSYRKDLHYPGLLKRIEQLGLGSCVRELGYIEDQLLPDLYRMADVFVFASLYEGFGLPVLEAMASAVPVVVANNSSMPEVVRDAGFLLPEDDIEAWVRSIKEIAKSPELQLELGQKAMRRAGLFTWDRTAELTLEAYSKIFGVSPRV